MYLLFQNLKDTVGAHAVARAAGDAQGVVDLNGVIALVIDVSGERQRLARAVVHAVAAALAADGVDLDLAHVDKPPCNMRGSRSLLGCFALCDLLGLRDGADGRNHAQRRRADAVDEDTRIARVAVGVDPVAEHGVHEHIRDVADKRRNGDRRRGDRRRDAHLGLDGEICALAQEHRDADQKQQSNIPGQAAVGDVGHHRADARREAGDDFESYLIYCFNQSGIPGSPICQVSSRDSVSSQLFSSPSKNFCL